MVILARELWQSNSKEMFDGIEEKKSDRESDALSFCGKLKNEGELFLISICCG